MASFDEYIAEKTKQGGNGVPGVILKGIDKTGKIFYSKIAGHAGPDESAPPLQESFVFKIASLSKLVTSVATMQCVERGLIGLDDSVFDIVPELAALEIISSPDEDKSFTFTKPSSPITPRMLLTHSAGLIYGVLSPTIAAWKVSRGEQPSNLDFKLTVPEEHGVPLVYEPGQGWAYSSGLDWAGYLIRRLNGNISLAEYLNENVWKPLGLQAPYPTFDLDKNPDMKERLVPVAERTENGGFKAGHCSLVESPSDEHGGGGLALTVGDYLALLGDLVSEKPKLLKRETVESMFSPQFAPGSKALEALDGPGRVMYGVMLATPDAKVNHGLGGALLAEDDPKDKAPKDTMMWGGMTNCIWFMNRRIGVAGLYMSQMLPPAEAGSAEIMARFRAEFWKMVGV